MLLHYLNSEIDEGIVAVRCELNTDLDKDVFVQSWQELAKRHSALRTQYRWENISHPVQIVQQEHILNIDFKDWTSMDRNTYKKRFDQFIQTQKKEGINLLGDEIHRIYCIQKSENIYGLIWICHHINIDGWSSAIVLNELLTIYSNIVQGKPILLNKLPDQTQFLKWKKNKSVQSKSFWSQYLSNLGDLRILANKPLSNLSLKEDGLILPTEVVNNLKTLLKQNRLTLSTFFQGLWGYLLSNLLGTKDVIFGTIVSGRSIDFANIEKMVGMFTNILPSRVKIDHQTVGVGWLQNLQSDNYSLVKHSLSNITDILSSIDFNGSLFDSVFIFENYPSQILGNETIRLENASSDIVSSYPLSIIILPKEKIEIKIRYNETIIDKFLVHQIISSINAIISGFVNSQIFPKIESSDLNSFENLGTINEVSTRATREPTNELELILWRIWKDVLNLPNISIDDNFFDIGGSSFTAIQVFSKIQAELQLDISPVVLLKQGSISLLAKLIQNTSEKEIGWSSIIKLKNGSNKEGLFCFHAASGHAMFYREFAESICNLPIYAVQSRDLVGRNWNLDTIPQIAEYYLEEILKVQPQGPYHLLGGCLSNAITFEMAHLIEKKNLKLGKVFIIDSPPPYYNVVTAAKLIKWMNWLITGKFKKLKSAFYYYFEYLNLKPDESGQQRDLLETRIQIKKLLKNYKWIKSDIDLHLIRSTECANDKFRSNHYLNWKKLTTKSVYTETIDSDNASIFKMPAVKNMASVIEKLIKN